MHMQFTLYAKKKFVFQKPIPKSSLKPGNTVIHVERRVARVFRIKRVDADIVVEDGTDGFLLLGDELISECEFVRCVIKASHLEHTNLNIHRK